MLLVFIIVKVYRQRAVIATDCGSFSIKIYSLYLTAQAAFLKGLFYSPFVSFCLNGGYLLLGEGSVQEGYDLGTGAGVVGGEFVCGGAGGDG